MSRASAFTPAHAQQMHELRQWAREQGRTHPGDSNAERQARREALAQDPALPREAETTEPSGITAPDISSEGS